MRSLQLMFVCLISIFLLQSCEKDQKKELVNEDEVEQLDRDESASELLELSKAGLPTQEKQLEGSGILATKQGLPTLPSAQANARFTEVLLVGSQGLNCGSSIRGNNFNTGNNIGGNTYQRGCLNNYYSFRSNDVMYPMYLDSEGEINLTLTEMTTDLDLFVFTVDRYGYLDQCVGYSINAYRSDESLTLNLNSGEYAVIVDGYIGGLQSYFTLSANCSEDGGCQDFDNLYRGEASSQLTDLIKWNDYARYDAEVRNNRSYSGRQSLYLDRRSGVAAADQPDVVKMLGERTSGRHYVSWKMYIPSNSNAHFNTQKFQQLGREYGLETYLRMGRGIAVRAKGQLYQSPYTYPQNRWFDVFMDFDLDNQRGYLWVDGKCVISWDLRTQSGRTSYGNNRIAGINYYAYSTYSTFYIDDLCVEEFGGNEDGTLFLDTSSLSDETIIVD